MKVRGSLRLPGVIVALGMLTACGAPAIAPSSVPLESSYVGTSAITATQAASLRAISRFASARPEKRLNAKYYEYIIDDYGSYAGIFDYPRGTKAIGYIKNVGGQGCTNVLYGYGKKTFWIVAGAAQISEYAAPHKLLKSLSDSVGAPSSCAMNASGDLAVGILGGTGRGDVVIYKNATGTGTAYPTGLAAEFFDGYDASGNLFADGLTSNETFQLVELPAGQTKFSNVSTSNTVTFPGSVQWDGTYLDVTDQRSNAIYQYTIGRSTATLQNTISLSGSGDCSQTWIATGVLYCADAANDAAEVFNYPAGGTNIATFTGNFDLPLGTVAVKK